MFSQGISREGDILDLGVETNIIKKSGAFFSYEDDRLGQGRENAKTFLKENENIARSIEEQIRSAMSPEESSDEDTGSETIDEDGELET